MADSDEEYESKRERNKFRNERYEEGTSGTKSTSEHASSKHSNKRYIDSSDADFYSNKHMKGYDMAAGYHRYPRQDDQAFSGRSYNYYHDHKKKLHYPSNGNGNRDRRNEMMYNNNNTNQFDYMEMNTNFNNHFYDQHPEQNSKRFCADNWNMFGETGYDGAQSYFEHDNRFDPSYDRPKEYHNNSNRPNRTHFNSQAPYAGEYNRFGSQSSEMSYSNNGHFNKHKTQRFSNFNQHVPSQTNPFAYKSDNGQANFYNNNHENYQQYAHRNYAFANVQFSHQNQAMAPMYQQYANEPYHQHSNFNTNGANNGNNYNDEQTNYLMTFRHFLNTLPNRQSTPHDVANKMYNDYRNNYRKEQHERFFAAHKHEDWFRVRYHPEESLKRKQEQNKSVRNRLDIFMHLMEKFNYLNESDSANCGLSLEMSSQEARSRLLKFLDACMIRLEGGEDSDLAVLDQVYKNESNETCEKQEANEPAESESNEAQKEEGEEKVEKEESKIEAKEPEATIEIAQRTKSIFFKHLPVIVTKQDLENIGKKYDGFKRAAISEPAPDRRFQRRGWITFDNSVNIKDLCVKINGTKLYNMNLIVSVNRDFDDRIKQISALANHAKIVRNDLKLIVKIVTNMDKRWNLWSHESNQVDNKEEIELKENPLLKAAEEHLQSVSKEESQTERKHIENKVEQKEEQEETSENVQEQESETKEQVEKEKEEEKVAKENEKPSAVKKVDFYRDLKAEHLLDKLILYLRIVHSIDFYSASEYQQEDNMPNRCGVLHVRTSSNEKNPSNLVNILNGPNVNKAFDVENLSQEQLDEWMRLFEVHVKSFVDYVDQIDADLAKKLGLKEVPTEIEKFITANCKQIEKNVWLCPLSGKKFKGADYVRKHIETKFTDKMDEVRAEVDYFNRFILDPKRPFLPEFPPNNSNRNNQQQFVNNRSNGFNYSKH